MNSYKVVSYCLSLFGLIAGQVMKDMNLQLSMIGIILLNIFIDEGEKK